MCLLYTARVVFSMKFESAQRSLTQLEHIMIRIWRSPPDRNLKGRCACLHVTKNAIILYHHKPYTQQRATEIQITKRATIRVELDICNCCTCYILCRPWIEHSCGDSHEDHYEAHRQTGLYNQLHRHFVDFRMRHTDLSVRSCNIIHI